MDVLTDDRETEEVLMVGLSDAPIPMKPHASHHDDTIKVLWSNSDTNMVQYEDMQEGIKVKSPCTDDEQSLGSHIGDPGDGSVLVGTIGHDQILATPGSLQLKQEAGENGILETGDMTPGDMLPGTEEADILPGTEEADMLPGTEGPDMLASSNNSETTLTTDLTATHGEHDVIQFLLPTSADASEGVNGGLQSMTGLSLASMGMSTVLAGPSQTVQAITLADGNTAFIQHTGSSKFLEGQTITLDDGSTAVIQAINSAVSSVNYVSASGGVARDVTVSSLQDPTSAFLSQSVKDSLQAIILEDGSTAYLATQPTGAGLLDSRALDTPALRLDTLTAVTTGQLGQVAGQQEGSQVVSIDPSASMASTVVAGAEPSQGQPSGTIPGTAGPDAPEIMAMEGLAESQGGQLIIEKGYRCKFDGCNRFYTTLHHLRVHERSHTGDRPFKCEFAGCGKAFATGYGLKSHIRVHTGEKPYKCPNPGCMKAFKTSGDLQKHVRTHTGERPFKCPFVGCDRSFTTSNIRKVHIRTHTGERPYICPEEDCGRAFASATNYKNHVRIHTGEKPYVCTVMGCGKRFTEYSSLYKHHVVHTHTKPYTCDRCGKTYRQTSTLAMHKRTAHGEDVTAETEALLFQQQHAEGSLEPVDKRVQLGFVTPEGLGEDGEGALIINTSDAQQFALVSGDGLPSSTDGLPSPLSANHAIFEGSNLTFAVANQAQQVFVITDPAQLEALQQIAKHQIDAEQEVEQSLEPSLATGEPVAMEMQGITMVTEIAKTDPTASVNVQVDSLHDIANL